MKNSKRIACLLLTLLVSGYLAVRLEVQLHHSLEEVSYHSQLAAAQCSASKGESQPGIHSGQAHVQDIHICHSCLMCSPRLSVAFQPAKEWSTRLVTGSSLASLRRLSVPSRHIDCPNRRAPPLSS